LADNRQTGGNRISLRADGTGGTYFHNNNDLENGLKSLAASPEVVYLLALSLKECQT